MPHPGAGAQLKITAPPRPKPSAAGLEKPSALGENTARRQSQLERAPARFQSFIFAPPKAAKNSDS